MRGLASLYWAGISFSLYIFGVSNIWMYSANFVGFHPDNLKIINIIESPICSVGTSYLHCGRLYVYTLAMATTHLENRDKKKGADILYGRWQIFKDEE